MLQIQDITQGGTVCNFLLAPTLKSVALGNRATVSVKPCVTLHVYYDVIPSYNESIKNSNDLCCNIKIMMRFLKGLAQAKIIKKSVILFRVLNMTI